jgi:hypothetical protein
VIGSQRARAANTVPWASRGWDNAEKDGGRKRHIAVDATGLVLAVVITAASVQDRDAARPLLWNLSAAAPASARPGLMRDTHPAPRHPEAVTTKSSTHLDSSYVGVSLEKGT